MHCHPWTFLRVDSVQEDHGGSKYLIRVRFRVHLSALTKSLGLLAGGIAGLAVGLHLLAGIAAAGLLLASVLGLWWRGASLAGRVAASLDEVAASLNMSPCESSRPMTEGTILRLRHRAEYEKSDETTPVVGEASTLVVRAAESNNI